MTKLEQIKAIIDDYFGDRHPYGFRPSEDAALQEIRILLARVDGRIAVADGVGPHPYLRLHTVREENIGYRGMGIRTWCNQVLGNGHVFDNEEDAKSFALTKRRLGLPCPRCRDAERSVA